MVMVVEADGSKTKNQSVPHEYSKKASGVQPVVDWNGSLIVVGMKVKPSPVLVFGEFKINNAMVGVKNGTVVSVEVEQGGNAPLAVVQWDDEDIPEATSPLFLEIVKAPCFGSPLGSGE